MTYISFLMKPSLLVYKLATIMIGSVFLRFVPSRIAVAIMKRLHLDIRICWEFERLYFLYSEIDSRKKITLLRLYYLVTPQGFGLAWGCAMESTFRIINIFESNIDLETVKPFMKVEYWNIENNLESHSNNNHWLFNIVGCSLLSKYFNELKYEYWLDLLKTECRNQFYFDGGNFESSSNYHLLSLELLLLASRLNVDVKSIVFESINIKGAVELANLYYLSDDKVFLFGDNDSSFNLKSNYPRDEQNLRINHLSGIGSVNLDQLRGKLFRNTGLFFDETDNGLGLLLWNPPVGQDGKGGHDHNDNLSLLLRYSNNPILIDPGVYYYSIFRDKFRSENVHGNLKSIEFKHEDFISKFSCSDNLLRYNDISSDCVLSSITNNNSSLVRTVRKIGNTFHIQDEYKTNLSNRVGLTIDFVLAEGISVSELKRNCFTLNDSTHRVSVIFEFNDSVNFSSEIIMYSSEYGRLRETRLLKVTCDMNKINWKIRVV